MKNFLGKRLTLALIAFVALAGAVYSQTSIYEVEGFLVLRPTNPQIRMNGTLSVLNRLGTAPAILGKGRPVIISTASARTLTVGECDAIVIANGAVAEQVFTLPAVANAGCRFTFIQGFVDGTTEVRFKSAEAGTDCIFTHQAAVGVDFDTGIVTEADCETGIKNTAATNAIGNNMTIVSDGTRWLGVQLAGGIWAIVS